MIRRLCIDFFVKVYKFQSLEGAAPWNGRKPSNDGDMRKNIMDKGCEVQRQVLGQDRKRCGMFDNFEFALACVCFILFRINLRTGRSCFPRSCTFVFVRISTHLAIWVFKRS